MKNFMNGVKNKILSKFVEKWLSGNKEVSLQGPLFWENPEDRKIINLVVKFRSEQNKTRAPYLESKEQKQIEKELTLDQRSAHFVAFKQGEVAACIRLTPGPFEMGHLHPLLKDRTPEFAEFYEFSRLCTRLNLKTKGAVSCLLLLKAGLWLFSYTNAKGIVGICKLGRVRYMSKFGLSVQEECIKLEGREDHYSLIAGSRSQIIMCFLKYFLGLEHKSNSITPLKIVTPWSNK